MYQSNILPLALTILMPIEATAQAPMSAEEFESYTAGKTLTFADSNGDYGGEQYLPDRRVFWSLLDGRCIEGTWGMQGDQICFAYEGIEDVQCWHFHLGGHGLWAQYRGDDGGFVLYETERTEEPLYCMGPDVGS